MADVGTFHQEGRNMSPSRDLWDLSSLYKSPGTYSVFSMCTSRLVVQATQTTLAVDAAPAGMPRLLGPLACPLALLRWLAPLACPAGLPRWPAPMARPAGLPHWLAPLACPVCLPRWLAPLACPRWPAPLACPAPPFRMDVPAVVRYLRVLA